FFSPRVKNAGHSCPDKPAVKHQSTPLDHENICQWSASEILLPIRDDIKDARSGDAADDEPNAEILNRRRVYPIANSAPTGGPETGDKADHHQHAVPVDRKCANMKSNRLHAVIKLEAVVACDKG